MWRNLGYCYEGLIDFSDRARVSRGVIALTWFLIPFNIQMVLHPEEVTRLQHWLVAKPQPDFFTTQMLIAGEVTALLTLAILGPLLRNALHALNRKTRYGVTLRLVAGVFVGVVGNAVWWAALAQGFDIEGFLAGFGPVLCVLGCQLSRR